MAATNQHIKQGFICPECLKEFRTQELLLSHFGEHKKHEKSSLKIASTDLLAKLSAATRRKTTNNIEELVPDQICQYKGKLFIQRSIAVPAGVTRSHIEDLKEQRRQRLDHRVSEANMLIIRLDRLLRCDEADRKQAAEELVLWIDGKIVSRCPNCAHKFNVISRRQHHCRLCGSVMCNSSSCSAFLTYNQARLIVGPFDVSQGNTQSVQSSSVDSTDESIRLCTYCFAILETRRKLQVSQHMRPPLCDLYDHLVHLKQDIQTSVELYHEMHESLTAGDTVHLLQDAQSLHSSIARKVDVINALSQKISAIDVVPSSSLVAIQLHTSVRQATSQYIKEQIATLPSLPTPQQIERIKAKIASDNGVNFPGSEINLVKKVVVTTGWNGENAVAAAKFSENPDNEDPLIQQINIVREYIRQAREAQRYEEIVTLKENLSDLKQQYQLQLEQEQQLAQANQIKQ